ncbi:glucose-6-phosphate isomerase [Flavobacteriaceae bacterium]|nr:glucose-6-phosphate isomerase [Flavobacteriaceae bacterium]
MALPNINPTTTQSWKKLRAHFEEIKDISLQKHFAENPNRFEEFSIVWEDFLVDYSKNRLTKETLNLLEELANEVGLKEAMEAYFQGEAINQTEKRAVLHTALRVPEETQIYLDGLDVVPEIHAINAKIKTFCDQVISGEHKGYSGKSITHVVNIGIGGSDLGPAMVTEALAFYKNHLNVQFVSNVEGDHVREVIKTLDPETTLFVIVSKTFTTQETLSNASTIRKWFLMHAPEEAIAKHFVAVSTNEEKIAAFGIHPDNVFPMKDWVGGRFSLWSAVGLSIALAVGPDHFNALLRGAHKMDEHFKKTPFQENIPVVLSLLSIWYNNFWKAESEAIIPYTQYLKNLPAYLQQGIMESNGKGVDRNGEKVNYQTGTIIWGGSGTNAQHAFFQHIHQGTKLIPADFIGFKSSLYGEQDHQNKLMANFIAQTEALMRGKTLDEATDELKAKGIPTEEIKRLAPFKVFEGNKPTNTLLIDQLSPESIGKLIAMYEQKIFVQGVLWNIFSYDQWGVELGKQLANTVLEDISGDTIAPHDQSTTALLKHLKEL